MRVKIIECDFFTHLESKINSFLRSNEVEVIDIKYSTYVNFDRVYYTCMIIYK